MQRHTVANLCRKTRHQTTISKRISGIHHDHHNAENSDHELKEFDANLKLVAELAHNVNGEIWDDEDADAMEELDVAEEVQRDTAHPMRLRFFRIVYSPMFTFSVNVLILLNIVLVVMETDNRAAEVEQPHWLKLVEYIIVGLFTAEMAMKLYVCRLHFFDSPLAFFELLIVTADVVLVMLGLVYGDVGSVAIFRILRCAKTLRLMRAVRTMRTFRELYMMLHGFFGAMKAIFWAAVLLTAIVFLWAIVAVEFVHPVNRSIADTGFYDSCERCPRAYASVTAASLTILQNIIAGDSWGVTSVPVMEEAPLAIPFFILVFVSIQLGVMNLILSVIVDKAGQAREMDKSLLSELKKEQVAYARQHLMDICKEMDTDQSGDLLLGEILAGFDGHAEFTETMAAAGICREDAEQLFHMMDEDGSGSVNYEEFVELLSNVLNENTDMKMIMMTKTLHDMKDSQKTLQGELVVKLQSQSEELTRITRLFGLPPSLGTGAKTPVDDSGLDQIDACFKDAPKADFFNARVSAILRILVAELKALAQDSLATMSTGDLEDDSTPQADDASRLPCLPRAIGRRQVSL